MANRIVREHGELSSIGKDCIYNDTYTYPHTYVAKERTFVLLLRK